MRQNIPGVNRGISTIQEDTDTIFYIYIFPLSKTMKDDHLDDRLDYFTVNFSKFLSALKSFCSEPCTQSQTFTWTFRGSGSVDLVEEPSVGSDEV